ncbi:DUF885 domain-containing protein [Adhaeribacter rhizoryzae]|uniref:DUF885 domain-containing protein n=1 Tax=Adhaeribacter rhizoryzae TaxID=2607907 RepID=A0A5M6CWE9_9BACT|nr:DUF885 domain-containing protein [Adhaeribacter rhizoryzae]
MRNIALSIALTGCLALLLIACNQQKTKVYSATEKASETKQLNDFFERNFQEMLARNPEYESFVGGKKNYDQWTDRSDEHARQELEITKANLAAMRNNFDYAALDAQGQLSYKMYEYQAEEEINNFKYRFHNYLENQMSGLHSDLPAFLINIHQVADVKDARAYIARLAKVDSLFQQHLESLKIREDKGIIPPKFVFPMMLEDCRNLLKGQPFSNSELKSPLLDDFTGKINKLNIAASTKDSLLTAANQALLTSVKPAYEKLITYFTTLEKKAPQEGGAWQFPEAADFYKTALRATTTTDLTADQIHEIGLQEVARIQKEMRTIMRKVNFRSDSLPDFYQFMRTDKQFYFPNTAAGKKAYMDRANQIIDNMKNRLDELFITKPVADIEVKAVEPFREKSAAGAFYEQPSLDGKRPGRYYINLFTLGDQPIYQMESLAYHEGIPGHHMQIAIAQELKGIPKFRTLGGNTAYVEGWALYSELVPKEIGLYQDPYSDFGRLANEIFRACRLVIDTGIHHKKWTKQQALDYFIRNCPSPENDLRKEVERYVVWPSQATGYKIGMLKIVELREQAKKQLGEKFDLREFHDVVLTNGAVPLNILAENVNNWVKQKQAAKVKA